MSFSFDAQVWSSTTNPAWHFVSLPDALADDIEERFGRHAAGFGSLRVAVRIGGSRWNTSIFPDSRRRTYVLPLKKQVRAAEGLDEGSTASVELSVELDGEMPPDAVRM